MKKISSNYRSIRKLSTLLWNSRVVALAVTFSCLIFQVNAAQLHGQTLTAPIPTKVVPRLKSLLIYPTTKSGGALLRPEGTVELDQAPGQEGVTVKLESSNPELAHVPYSVTITHGAMSSETGPLFKAKFYVTTQPVKETTIVVIRARLGAQSLETNFWIRPPMMQSANFEHPYSCDGKATLHYNLTGPAPSGFTVRADVKVHRQGGYSTAGESESVPIGNLMGSMRMTLPRCGSTTAQWCTISGLVLLSSTTTPSSSSNVSFGGACPPSN